MQALEEKQVHKIDIALQDVEMETVEAAAPAHQQQYSVKAADIEQHLQPQKQPVCLYVAIAIISVILYVGGWLLVVYNHVFAKRVLDNAKDVESSKIKDSGDIDAFIYDLEIQYIFTIYVMVHLSLNAVLGVLKQFIEKLKKLNTIILDVSYLIASLGWWIGDMVYKWKDYGLKNQYAGLKDDDYDDLKIAVDIVVWLNIASIALVFIIGIVTCVTKCRKSK